MPEPEELNYENGYEFVKELRHDDIVEFVISQIKQLRWPMVLFYGFNLILIFLIVAFTAGNVIHTYISWGLYWQFLLFGLIAGMILIIPVHEIIHGMAYKLAGAPKVKFGADLKQMMFYASAPGFVAARYDFYVVAFSPFVLINLFFISGIVFGSIQLQWGSLVALFIHSTMCIGDFAMVNYFTSFRGREIYTYDDHKQKRSYFYIRRSDRSDT